MGMNRNPWQEWDNHINHNGGWLFGCALASIAFHPFIGFMAVAASFWIVVSRRPTKASPFLVEHNELERKRRQGQITARESRRLCHIRSVLNKARKSRQISEFVIGWSSAGILLLYHYVHALSKL